MEIEIISGSMNNIGAAGFQLYSATQIPAYWRAVEFLSSNLASFPIDVLQHKARTTHPLDRLLKRKANPTQTSFAVLKTLYYHGEHLGNGYVYIVRDPITALPIALFNLEPAEVTPFRLTPEGGTILDTETWYWHLPSKKPIAYSDVLHYRPQVSYDGLVGYAPATMFASTFDRAHMLETFQTKFLRKGTLIRGAIELPQGTTKEQRDEILNTLKSYRASTGDKDTILLTGGAKLSNATISPVDAQLAEQDAAITRKISQITGVPQQFLMDTVDTKYNAATVEAYGQDVVRFCFRPRLAQIESELTTKLLTEEEQDSGMSMELDTSALIRGDTAVEMTIATQGVAGGLLTRNEGRTQIGEPAVADPAADKLLVPTHVATESESPNQSASETHSAAPAPDQYAAFQPLIEAAAQRVEIKTEKAFATAQKKPEAERIIAFNVLAESQGGYAAEAFQPIAQTLETMTGKRIDVAAISEAYSAEIRKRAAGKPTTDLIQIVGNINARTD